MHSYQHNIKTFNNATRHLTRVERSLYRDAIELYYDEEKPITSDFGRLCRVLIAVTDEEKNALKYVLDSFFTLSNGFYMHKYCEEVIERYAGNTNAKSMAGKASAAARRAKFEAKINGCSTDDEQVLNEIQLTRNQETNKPINQEPKTNKPSLKKESTLAEYIEQCKESGVEALQDGSEAHTVADKLGLSDEMLGVAWYEFKHRHIDSSKKYASWVKAFSNSLRQNWYKIWYLHDNAVFWTNEGKGLCKLHLGYMPDNLNV